MKFLKAFIFGVTEGILVLLGAPYLFVAAIITLFVLIFKQKFIWPKLIDFWFEDVLLKFQEYGASKINGF